MKRLLPLIIVAVLGYIAVSAFGGLGGPKTTLHIVSGSENRALEPIIKDWGNDNHVAIEVSYLGSVDIARSLADGASSEYDAVWPANSLWIELGDTGRVVAHDRSILRSPVVLA